MTGELIDGKEVVKNDKIYEGQFDRLNGKLLTGTCLTFAGSKMEGIFEDGILRFGKRYYTSNYRVDYLEGEFDHLGNHVKGREVYKNGSIKTVPGCNCALI